MSPKVRPPASLTIVSWDQQQGIVGTELPQPDLGDHAGDGSAYTDAASGSLWRRCAQNVS